MSPSRRWVTLATSLAITALAIRVTFGAGGRAADRSVRSESDAASFRDETSRASLEYAAARVAPGVAVPASAFASARLSATSLRLVHGTWSEVTNQPYDSDAQGYRDPTF